VRPLSSCAAVGRAHAMEREDPVSCASL
jgi:hypothetical protein